MSKRSTSVRARIALLALLVCLASVALLVGCNRSGGSGTEVSSKGGTWVDSLGDDQKRVAEEFGPPSTFGLSFGTDVMGAIESADAKAYRLEWWDYPEMGSRFVFSDGEFLAREDIADPTEGSATEIYYPAVTPGDFSEGMSPDEVKDVLGGGPTSEVSFKPEIMAGLTAHDWNGVVTAVFDEKGLVGIQTRPATEGGAE